MKKLMIGMLAAGAAIASAWAANEAGSTFSSENFNSKDEGAFSIAAPWTNAVEDTEFVAGELTIKTGGHTSEGKFLELNTASKKLSLAPTPAGAAYTVTEEVYFDSYVKFDAASDTIPEVDVENDKLALFVLDNTNYVESDPTTALYVLGGYMNGNTLEKRLYKLNTIVDAQFLAGFQHISIKMYSNVMPTGTTAIPGFLVKVGDGDAAIATVAAAYTTDANGEWDLGTDVKGDSGKYLGATIAPAVAASRYNSDKDQLILGLKKADSTLNAVDFMGKGGIDDLAFTNVKNSYGFDADAQLFTVGEYPSNVSGVYESNEDAVGGTNKLAAATTIDVSNGKATLWVALDGNYYLNGDKIVEVSVGAGDNLADVLSNLGTAYEADLTIGDKGYAADALGKVPLANGISGEIVLLDDISGYSLYVTGNATLNLNGKTLGADDYGESVSVNGNNGALRIFGAGTVNGEVALYDGGTATIDLDSTATFLAKKDGADVNTKAALDAMLPVGATKEFGDPDGDGYYALVDKAVEDVWSDAKAEVEGVDNTNKDAVEDRLEEIQAAISEEADADDVAEWLGTVYPGDKKVTVAELLGAKNIDISVNFDLPLMQNDPVITVEASTVEAPAEGQAVAAFEFTITDGKDGAELTPARVDKILGMVQYVESLTGTWTGATSTDVDTKINGKKIKVQLKKKVGKNCGFMKLKLR